MGRDDTNVDLEAVLARSLHDTAVPGAAVAIVDAGRVSFATSGVTSVEHPLPVTEDTLFQVGSVTKPFTGTVLAMLVEEGRLDLDAPIRSYVPELRLADREVERAITAKHLLGHTAGFEGDHFPVFDGADALERFVATLSQLPQHFAPGARPSYSNAGYSLLGRVIEILENDEYAAVMRRRLLEPLGMQRSGFSAGDAMTHRVAIGHVVHAGAPRVVRPWHVLRTIWPAGGLITSARDLAVFAQFHLGDGRAADGRRLLHTSTLEQMRVPLAPSSLGVNGLDSTAFAWNVGRPAGRAVASHGGSTVSFRAQLTLIPDQRSAFVVVANADRGMAVVGAVRAAVGAKVGLPPPPERTFVKIHPAPYLGTYESALHRIIVRASDGGVELDAVRRQAGGLDAHQEPKPEPFGPMRARFIARDEAVIVDGMFSGLPVPFLRSPQGQVSSMRFVGRITPRIA